MEHETAFDNNLKHIARFKRYKCYSHSTREVSWHVLNQNDSDATHIRKNARMHVKIELKWSMSWLGYHVGPLLLGSKRYSLRTNDNCRFPFIEQFRMFRPGTIAVTFIRDIAGNDSFSVSGDWYHHSLVEHDPPIQRGDLINQRPG